MDDRRLVGMSNSARRRAARAWAVNPDAVWSPRERRSLSIGWGGLVRYYRIEARYAEARKRYRVGERLGLCGGCHRCWDEPRIFPWACDGSGVVRK
jgi:hypothetical protein